GGLVWSGAFIALGWIFSRQLELVAEYAAQLGSWTLALLAAALAGYIAWKFISRQRFLRKIRIARITPEELKAMLDGGEKMLIVDVRDRIDFEAEPTIIPGALHLTIEELEERHQEIPREREIILYCT
ncbi:MAG TPA: rhodanese-like domain-containing protein, partial [Methylomirabilota bacterium]|nr:rhodanese-like domain-containing protein [Methylomirabilota bacterium]